MVVDRLPWYGYDNTCIAGTAPDARSCARGKSGAELGKAGEFFQELPLMLDPRHKDACDPPRRKCGPESFDRSLHTVLGLLANRSSPFGGEFLAFTRGGEKIHYLFTIGCH